MSDVKPLPARIPIGGGQFMRVVECPLENGYGEMDIAAREIRIRADLDPATKHYVLFHHLIQMAEESNVRLGEAARHPDKRHIVALCGTLFGLLANSGLLAGVPPEAYSDWSKAGKR